MNEEDYDNRIILHVYDLTKKLNDKVIKIGFGIFHTGIEIGGKEYWFFGHEYPFTGVIVLEPGIKTMGTMIKRTSVVLGETKYSYSQVKEVIDDLSKEYIGNSYHPLRRNCNHFTDDMSRRLLSGKRIPKYVNRAAFFARCILKVIPEKVIWWILMKLMSSSATSTREQQNNNANPTTIEKKIEDEPLLNDDSIDIEENPLQRMQIEEERRRKKQFQEFIDAAVASEPTRQREISTYLFMTVNQAMIRMTTRDDDSSLFCEV